MLKSEDEVDEGHRGQGIGRGLIEALAKWAKEKGNYRMRVRCNVKRKETHDFYKRLKFRELKEQKVFEVELI
ncbi:MAG: GNAT family N-acetyltransferase [Bacteroidia bacterium]